MEAVIDASPESTPRAKPVASMVATLVSFDSQATPAFDIGLPAVSRTAAVKRSVPPVLTSAGLAGAAIDTEPGTRVSGGRGSKGGELP
jgi:hypothetical protein